MIIITAMAKRELMGESMDENVFSKKLFFVWLFFFFLSLSLFLFFVFCYAIQAVLTKRMARPEMRWKQGHKAESAILVNVESSRDILDEKEMPL